jgi:hypothetical protein
LLLSLLLFLAVLKVEGANFAGLLVLTLFGFL